MIPNGKCIKKSTPRKMTSFSNVHRIILKWTNWPKNTKCLPSIVIALPFPWENAVEMTVGNPMPGGTRKRCSIFFWKMRETTLFFRFGARKPPPPAQGPIFQVSAQASANQRPRTTACGLHPGPLKCLVAWALTLKIVPWAGGVGSAADVWRCKWWSVIDEKVVVNRFYRSFQICMYVLLK